MPGEFDPVRNIDTLTFFLFVPNSLCCLIESMFRNFCNFPLIKFLKFWIILYSDHDLSTLQKFLSNDIFYDFDCHSQMVLVTVLYGIFF